MGTKSPDDNTPRAKQLPSKQRPQTPANHSPAHVSMNPKDGAGERRRRSQASGCFFHLGPKLRVVIAAINHLGDRSCGGRPALHEQRLLDAGDSLFVHHHCLDIRLLGQHKHGLREDVVHDGAQAARAGLAVVRHLGDPAQRAVGDKELDALQPKQRPVLLGQTVLGLGQDLDELVDRKLRGGQHVREAADELGDHAKAHEVLWLDLLEHVVQRAALELVLLVRQYASTKAHAGLHRAARDGLFQAGKGATADEEDLGGVHLDVLGAHRLVAALFGHVGNSSLQEFEQCLLNALAAHIARGAGPAALGDLVDFINVHDAALRQLYVKVGLLVEFVQNGFHIFADVARLGQTRRIEDDERHPGHTRERLGHECLATAGGPDQEHVRLVQLRDIDVDVPVEFGRLGLLALGATGRCRLDAAVCGKRGFWWKSGHIAPNEGIVAHVVHR
mmetsp:Transcript_22982/g.65262  ORF Transcript_22982/g.65262 Transcript_22982/m.65262 type:complete len:446 (-) Transcript_22982:1137-2474(-)